MVKLIKDFLGGPFLSLFTLLAAAVAKTPPIVFGRRSAFGKSIKFCFLVVCQPGNVRANAGWQLYHWSSVRWRPGDRSMVCRDHGPNC